MIHRLSQLLSQERPHQPPLAELAFDPATVKAAIVTCGGICPGINTVVRELVCCLEQQYGVTNVVGVRSGYRGFYSSDFLPLTADSVDAIHKQVGYKDIRLRRT